MGRHWAYLLTFNCALLACHADPPTGALEVQARGLRGTPVAGVAVSVTPVRTTDMSSREGTTDERGLLRFDDLALQTYEVELTYLERSTFAIVTIAGDSLRRERFEVDDLPGTDPRILFDAPEPPLVRGKPLSMSASFRDDRTAVTELRVQWSLSTPSGKTELLFDGRPDAFGDVYVDLDSVAVGTSIFAINVTDGDGRSARNSFTVTVAP